MAKKETSQTLKAYYDNYHEIGKLLDIAKKDYEMRKDIFIVKEDHGTVLIVPDHMLVDTFVTYTDAIEVLKKGGEPYYKE